MNPTRQIGVAGNLSGDAFAGINEKVAFLSSPRTYPDDVRHVEIRQTHMSWVFLTDKDAWKLKKPVRTEYVDLSTPKARQRNCLREVRLNRRLAKECVLGVEALTMDRQGNFQTARPRKDCRLAGPHAQAAFRPDVGQPHRPRQRLRAGCIEAGLRSGQFLHES